MTRLEHRNERLVELRCGPHGQSPSPVTGMRIEGIRELVLADIGAGIRGIARPEQRQPDGLALGAVTVLAVVEDRKAVLSVR